MTLYHWDLPLALYHRGGWLNRDVGGWFADYATLVAKRLGDRVKHWMPLNEPQVFLGAGLIQGRHAPGDKLRFAEFLLAAHNTLLAHGRAVQALRATPKLRGRIGTAQAGYNYVPATDSAADLAAAKARYFATADDSYKQNGYWLGRDDPRALPRRRREAVRRRDARRARRRHGDDQAAARLPGRDALQRRSGAPRARTASPRCPLAGRLPDHRLRVGGDARRSCGWSPPGCTSATSCRSSSPRTACPCATGSAADGGVHDPDRIDFMARYLREMAAAIAAGVPIEAYFHWSILDNFEWAEGYKHRFGLVYVNYETQERTIKDSGQVVPRRDRVERAQRARDDRARSAAVLTARPASRCVGVSAYGGSGDPRRGHRE